jgi:hypothetical protein
MTVCVPGALALAAAGAVALPRRLAHRGDVGVAAQHLEAVEDEGLALGGERARCVADAQVEMGTGGVAGEPERGDDLAAPHAVAGLHTDAARLQMLVDGEAAVAEIEGDGVPGGVELQEVIVKRPGSRVTPSIV